MIYNEFITNRINLISIFQNNFFYLPTIKRKINY